MKNNRNILLAIFKKIIAVVFSITIIVSLITFYEIEKSILKKDVVFLVQKNTSIRQISKNLTDNGIIKNQVFFYFFAKAYCKYYSKNIIAGEYELKRGSSIVHLMEVLTGGKVIQHEILIPQGFTVKQVIERIDTLDNITHFPGGIHNIKEGSLLPETYFYTYGTLDTDLIKRMKNSMQDFIISVWPKRDKQIDSVITSPEDAIILASIIEKETYIESEKPLIAGVYLNRLKKKMKLQADPTVVYGLGFINKNWNGRVLYSHLKSDSLYNTYRYSGLPPTPICNPGRKAILAVLHPQWTQKLFFVAESNGKHVFASDFNQHKENIKSIKEKQKTS